MKQSLIAAFKRKNVKDIMAEVLEAEGKEAEAQEVRDAGRLTNALIDRTCIGEVETDMPEEATEEEADLTYADEPVNGSIEEHEDIVKAIAKGKKKRAKRLLHDAVEGGMSGSIVKEFKKQIKEL